MAHKTMGRAARLQFKPLNGPQGAFQPRLRAALEGVVAFSLTTCNQEIVLTIMGRVDPEAFS